MKSPGKKSKTKKAAAASKAAVSKTKQDQQLTDTDLRKVSGGKRATQELKVEQAKIESMLQEL